jgi:hypothetical protein
MEAWQYNTAPQPARLMIMRIRFAGALPMVGWDTYLNGRGRMRGKLLGRCWRVVPRSGIYPMASSATRRSTRWTR